MMVSSSVDLPTPLRPSTARLPCCGISSETPSSTTESPYPARTPSNASSGSAMTRTIMTRFAKIDFAYACIRRDLIGRAFEQDAPAHHHDDAAGEAEHKIHVVFDEQHRDVRRQAGDDGEQLRTFA